MIADWLPYLFKSIENNTLIILHTITRQKQQQLKKNESFRTDVDNVLNSDATISYTRNVIVNAKLYIQHL